MNSSRLILRFASFMLGLLLPGLLYAQTVLPTAHHSYVMPGDSLWIETSLSAGDALTWSLWLAGAAENGGMSLSFRSADEGEIWNRALGGAGVNLKEDIKITRNSRYRLTLKSASKHGRPAELNAWPKLGKADRSPFPLPAEKRLAESFRAGDEYIVEFEFKLPDTTKLQSLLTLDLPRNLVQLWATTTLGDSLVGVSSVSRWFGESGKLSLRERAPQGGSLTFRLTLDVPFDGDATVFVVPGESPPPWLPKSARMTIIRRNDPWSVVAVAPAAPDTAFGPPRAPYVGLSLRSRGVDAGTIEKITGILSERDSLNAARKIRHLNSSTYDTSFEKSAHAFVAPAMQAAIAIPLTGRGATKNAPEALQLTWFVENPQGGAADAKLYEWRYDEAHVAFANAGEEWFWDGTVLPLKPELKVVPAAALEKPGSLKIPMHNAVRPPRFEQNGRSLIDQSRKVWGFYLQNSTADTLYFVFHPQQVVERASMAAARKWPKAARILIFVFAVLAIAGGWAYFIMHRREQNRKKANEELAAELEKARQTQLKLLPQSPMDITGLQLLGLHQSMQKVGGDYYDFFALADGRIIICVADVTGHGYKAALIMSNLQATMRAVAAPGKSMVDIVSLLNLEVFRRTNPEDFVTMIIGEISADRKKLTACNAGHNPGYIIKASGNITEISDGGLMLGAIESFPFSQSEFKLDAGDVIVFYTDGIPEATYAANGEMFGYERLKVFLAENRYATPRDIAQRLLRQVAPDETKPLEDDMAVVVARISDK
jgi:serine phosphatase RsbU (regulator of sigma subunit)